jgi:hypothetical protein
LRWTREESFKVEKFGLDELQPRLQGRALFLPSGKLTTQTRVLLFQGADSVFVGEDDGGHDLGRRRVGGDTWRSRWRRSLQLRLELGDARFERLGVQLLSVPRGLGRVCIQGAKRSVDSHSSKKINGDDDGGDVRRLRIIRAAFLASLSTCLACSSCGERAFLVALRLVGRGDGDGELSESSESWSYSRLPVTVAMLMLFAEAIAGGEGCSRRVLWMCLTEEQPAPP